MENINFSKVVYNLDGKPMRFEMESQKLNVHCSVSDGDLCENCDSVSLMHLDYLAAKPKKQTRKPDILESPNQETTKQRSRILRLVQFIWRFLLRYCTRSPAEPTRNKNDIYVVISPSGSHNKLINNRLGASSKYPPTFDVISSKYKFHMTNSLSN